MVPSSNADRSRVGLPDADLPVTPPARLFAVTKLMLSPKHCWRSKSCIPILMSDRAGAGLTTEQFAVRVPGIRSTPVFCAIAARRAEDVGKIASFTHACQ